MAKPIVRAVCAVIFAVFIAYHLDILSPWKIVAICVALAILFFWGLLSGRFSKTAPEEEGPVREAVDLYEVAGNVTGGLFEKAEKKGILLELRGEHVKLIAVPEEIDQLLHQLCEQAVRSGRPGDVVTIRVYSDDVYAVIEGIDTGIPKEYGGTVFTIRIPKA